MIDTPTAVYHQRYTAVFDSMEDRPVRTPYASSFGTPERGKHHGEIPVVDSAGIAALIAHEDFLEGTEHQDTDQIADRIDHGQHKQRPMAEHIQPIQQPDGEVP